MKKKTKKVTFRHRFKRTDHNEVYQAVKQMRINQKRYEVANSKILDTLKPLTLADVGAQFGISGEAVRQIVLKKQSEEQVEDKTPSIDG